MQAICRSLCLVLQIVKANKSVLGTNIAARRAQEFFICGNKIRMVVPEGPLESNSMSP